METENFKEKIMSKEMKKKWKGIQEKVTSIEDRQRRSNII